MRPAAAAVSACFHALYGMVPCDVSHRKARAKAVQGGASYEEIRHAIDACLLCGL